MNEKSIISRQLVYSLFNLREMTYQNLPLIHPELRPPSWIMVANFPFLAIFVEAVGVTKTAVEYKIKGH